MRLPHGATAPSLIVSDSSGTSASRSTWRSTPVPWQVGHAPSELKAICSAPRPKNSSPQTGQTKGTSSATFMPGPTSCPLGQR